MLLSKTNLNLETDMEENKKEKIELRREKGHRSIGEIPDSILKWGYVILGIIAASLAVAWFLISRNTY